MPARRALAAFLTILLAAAGAAPGARVALSVDWGGATLARPFPVTGGLPLPRGSLRDPRHVRLVQAGREVPLQTEVLAWWPDRSVKWLLVDFQAVPGTEGFSLEFGEGIAAKAVTDGILASEQNGVVGVDTRELRFTVRPDGSGFIDELSFRGERISKAAGKRLNFLDFIHTKRPDDCRPMDRYVRDGEPDPSRVAVRSVQLEKSGPLHAVVLIDGKYTYRKVGSTITGTDVKGDCPFRIRIHAYASQSFLKVEHSFVYEGDGDHDFAASLGLKIGLPTSGGRIRLLGEKAVTPPGPIAGIYQRTCDEFLVWNSAGKSAAVAASGHRFEGVLDVLRGGIGIAVGVKDFWQNAPKSLHADLPAGELAIHLWPPEAPPLDFRRHAREWSVGETGSPDNPTGTKPVSFTRRNYRLASKGVAKTHYALIHCHPADAKPADVLATYKLFNHRPLLWAPPRHYAASRALGRYREHVVGDHEDVEQALASGVDVWKHSRERFRWFGFWLYGNVCQDYNNFIPNGRWCREFGRWGWANGDSVGRLAYALMLQAVRKCAREDFEFGESYLYHVHDVCSTHSPAYPHHYGDHFIYIKGAAHRHGAWPWACPYTGIRGAHPVGAKIYYFLTGEGHAKDILDEITQLALKFPNGGEGDGPLGPNALIFLYQWEATGDDKWRQRVKAELEKSDLLRKADSGWLCMMSAAFGILNALEEYMALSGDQSMKGLAAAFADRCLPAKMKRHWTWGGYFRVYAMAYNLTGDEKYKKAIQEMLDVLLAKTGSSLAFRVPRSHWPARGWPRWPRTTAPTPASGSTWPAPKHRAPSTNGWWSCAPNVTTRCWWPRPSTSHCPRRVNRSVRGTRSRSWPRTSPTPSWRWAGNWPKAPRWNASSSTSMR